MWYRERLSAGTQNSTAPFLFIGLHSVPRHVCSIYFFLPRPAVGSVCYSSKSYLRGSPRKRTRFRYTSYRACAFLSFVAMGPSRASSRSSWRLDPCPNPRLKNRRKPTKSKRRRGTTKCYLIKKARKRPKTTIAPDSHNKHVNQNRPISRFFI